MIGESATYDVFLKVATNLMDLLFIEVMSHISHVKQMFSQPMHLTHLELILCTNDIVIEWSPIGSITFHTGEN